MLYNSLHHIFRCGTSSIKFINMLKYFIWNFLSLNKMSVNVMWKYNFLIKNFKTLFYANKYYFTFNYACKYLLVRCLARLIWSLIWPFPTNFVDFWYRPLKINSHVKILSINQVVSGRSRASVTTRTTNSVSMKKKVKNYKT